LGQRQCNKISVVRCVKLTFTCTNNKNFRACIKYNCQYNSKQTENSTIFVNTGTLQGYKCCPLKYIQPGCYE